MRSQRRSGIVAAASLVAVLAAPDRGAAAVPACPAGGLVGVSNGNDVVCTFSCATGEWINLRVTNVDAAGRPVSFLRGNAACPLRVVDGETRIHQNGQVAFCNEPQPLRGGVWVPAGNACVDSSNRAIGDIGGMGTGECRGFAGVADPAQPAGVKIKVECWSSAKPRWPGLTGLAARADFDVFGAGDSSGTLDGTAVDGGGNTVPVTGSFLHHEDVATCPLTGYAEGSLVIDGVGVPFTWTYLGNVLLLTLDTASDGGLAGTFTITEPVGSPCGARAAAEIVAAEPPAIP